jgi:hypothetical protein
MLKGRELKKIWKLGENMESNMAILAVIPDRMMRNRGLENGMDSPVSVPGKMENLDWRKQRKNNPVKITGKINMERAVPSVLRIKPATQICIPNVNELASPRKIPRNFDSSRLKSARNSAELERS